MTLDQLKEELQSMNVRVLVLMFDGIVEQVRVKRGFGNCTGTYVLDTKHIIGTDFDMLNAVVEGLFPMYSNVARTITSEDLDLSE